MASRLASLPSLAIKSSSIIVMQIVLMDFHLRIAHVYDFCSFALCWPKFSRLRGQWPEFMSDIFLASGGAISLYPRHLLMKHILVTNAYWLFMHFQLAFTRFASATENGFVSFGVRGAIKLNCF